MYNLDPRNAGFLVTSECAAVVLGCAVRVGGVRKGISSGALIFVATAQIDRRNSYLRVLLGLLDLGDAVMIGPWLSCSLTRRS